MQTFFVCKETKLQEVQMTEYCLGYYDFTGNYAEKKGYLERPIFH